MTEPLKTPELPENFLRRVDQLLQSTYGINIADVDDALALQFRDEGHTAEDFVEWWGQKYELRKIPHRGAQ